MTGERRAELRAMFDEIAEMVRLRDWSDWSERSDTFVLLAIGTMASGLVELIDAMREGPSEW